jgi:hypothetical protein
MMTMTMDNGERRSSLRNQRERESVCAGVGDVYRDHALLSMDLAGERRDAFTHHDEGAVDSLLLLENGGGRGLRRPCPSFYLIMAPCVFDHIRRKRGVTALGDKEKECGTTTMLIMMQ